MHRRRRLHSVADSLLTLGILSDGAGENAAVAGVTVSVKCNVVGDDGSMRPLLIARRVVDVNQASRTFNTEVVGEVIITDCAALLPR